MPLEEPLGPTQRMEKNSFTVTIGRGNARLSTYVIYSLPNSVVIVKALHSVVHRGSMHSAIFSTWCNVNECPYRSLDAATQYSLAEKAVRLISIWIQKLVSSWRPALYLSGFLPPFIVWAPATERDPCMGRCCIGSMRKAQTEVNWPSTYKIMFLSLQYPDSKCSCQNMNNHEKKEFCKFDICICLAYPFLSWYICLFYILILNKFVRIINCRCILGLRLQ